MITDYYRYTTYLHNQYIEKYDNKRNYMLITDKKTKIEDLEIDDKNECIIITNLNDEYEINNIYYNTKQLIIKNSEFLMIIKEIPENIREIIVIKEKINILFENWQKYKIFYYMIEKIVQYDEYHLEEMIRIINEENSNLLRVIILRKNYKIFYKIIDRIDMSKNRNILQELLEINIMNNYNNYDDNVYLKLSKKISDKEIYKNNKNDKNIFHILVRNNTNILLFEKLFKRCKNKEIINNKDNNNLTVLHYLLYFNNARVFYIIKDYIDKRIINELDKSNNNIIYYYNHSKNDDILEYLVDNMDDKIFNKINDKRDNILYKIMEYNGNMYNRIDNYKKSNIINKILNKMSINNLLYKDEYDNNILSILIKNKYYECIPNILKYYDDYYLNIINLLDNLLVDYNNDNIENIDNIDNINNINNMNINMNNMKNRNKQIYNIMYNILLKKSNNENLKASYKKIFKTVDEEIIISYIKELKLRKINEDYLFLFDKYLDEIKNYTTKPDKKLMTIFYKCLKL